MKDTILKEKRELITKEFGKSALKLLLSTSGPKLELDY